MGSRGRTVTRSGRCVADVTKGGGVSARLAGDRRRYPNTSDDPGARLRYAGGCRDGGATPSGL